MMGLEPILPKKLDFESSASTNSATSAFCVGAEDMPAPLVLTRLFRSSFRFPTLSSLSYRNREDTLHWGGASLLAFDTQSATIVSRDRDF